MGGEGMKGLHHLGTFCFLNGLNESDMENTKIYYT